MIERLNERLQFYESFDALIQDNISRSGRLMREAAARREEAAEAVRQSRRQREREREQQRAMLTDLLDEVSAIQRATERLAHRVADTLEQIEFEIDPPGLGHAVGRRGALGASRSAAEDVHDELNRGVLGSGRAAGSFRPSLGATPPTVSDRTGQAAPEPVGVAEPDAGMDNLPAHSNPETEALSGNEDEPRDEPAPGMIHEHPDETQETAPNDGGDATSTEAQADTWDEATTTANDREVPSPSPIAGAGASEPIEPNGITASAGTAPAPDGTGNGATNAEATSANQTASSPDTATAAAALSDNDPDTATASADASPAKVVATPGDARPEIDHLIASVADLSLSGTSLVLASVPRAAVALAIQRTILANDDVLRAEVREYYDQRLTLQIISRRPIAAEDVMVWDAGNTWTVVDDTPDRIELRLESPPPI